MPAYPFLRRPEEVEALAKKLSREKVIAVDTEADSFFHYFEKLCLVQIGARSGIYLIDPLDLPENGLKPLERIFADPAVRKVFHAAEYDLYVLHRHSGIAVKNIFDTMVSAQLLGYPAVGLGALVESHFQVKLLKDQQRTDWSRRPLRPAQIDYAGADVKYLIEISRNLEKELRQKRRLAWAEEEFRSLEARVWPERDFDEQGYLRIKGAKKLAPRGLAVLRELYLMRDRRARGLDRPPFKVLGNGTLLDLAQSPPRSRKAFANRRGVTELVMRRMGKDLMDAVKRGTDGPEHPPLERKLPGNGRRRLDRRGEARLDKLKQWRAKRARELELDPGVFCPNATLEEVALKPRDSVDDLSLLAPLKRWWIEEFGAEILDITRTPEPAPAAEPAAVVAASSVPRRRPRGRRRGSGSGH